MNFNDPAILKSWESNIVEYMQGLEHSTDDASHDFSHFQRVWHTACQIMDHEPSAVNRLVVLAACYFHDIVVLPKDHPERSNASALAAEKTRQCLCDMDFPSNLVDEVCHAVIAHSYSANIQPETIEAQVVQDADRMEALGAIGLARVFYTAGILKQKLFDPEDPLAERRNLDDRKYSLDHFQMKLLKIAGTMKTTAGREMAERNSDYLRDFISKLQKELEGDYS